MVEESSRDSEGENTFLGLIDSFLACVIFGAFSKDGEIVGIWILFYSYRLC